MFGGEGRPWRARGPFRHRGFSLFWWARFLNTFATEAVSVAEATGVAVNSGVGVRLGVALNGGWVGRSVGAGRAADGSQTRRRRSM